jgi:D-alanyl-D-alanine carboxypeptidase/D-alanyl-D-alanine-endopeptidase (penicillin-binding protein 4)
MLSKFTPFLSILFFLGLFSCERHQPKHSSTDKLLSTLQVPKKPIKKDPLLIELDNLLADQNLGDAVIGYRVMDCTKGKPFVVAEHNPNHFFIPASTLKLLTTGAALETFGTQISRQIFMTNQNSLNWLANKLCKKVGEEKYQKRGFEYGCKAVTEFWEDKGLDVSGMKLYDGSGLSKDNSLTPKFLTDVLFYMMTSPYSYVFYNSLPLSGISGTLRRYTCGTPAEGMIRAKTGTVNGVKSFAGYVNTLSGKKLIFAIIVNNFTCREKVLKKKLEKVMVKMAEYKGA